MIRSAHLRQQSIGPRGLVESMASICAEGTVTEDSETRGQMIERATRVIGANVERRT